MFSAFKELVHPISPPVPLFTVKTKNYDDVVKVCLITEWVKMWDLIKMYDCCVPLSSFSLSSPSSPSSLSSSLSLSSVTHHPLSSPNMKTLVGPLAIRVRVSVITICASNFSFSKELTLRIYGIFFPSFFIFIFVYKSFLRWTTQHFHSLADSHFFLTQLENYLRLLINNN